MHKNLRELPLDKLKIDRAFVHEFQENDEAERLVRAITGLAGALNLRTVLEGIETEKQANLAKECGVTYGQGYYFATPMNAPDLEALLLGQTYSPTVA